MNFYGPESREEHTLTGRMTPLVGLLYRTIDKSKKGGVAGENRTDALPAWCEKIAEQLSEKFRNPVVQQAFGDDLT